MRGIRGSIFFTFLAALVLAPAAQAGGYNSLPVCEDNRGRAMQPNNEQVLAWKTSTPNQYTDRGFITGTLVGVLLDKGSHLRLDVFVGPDRTGGRNTDIELVYNRAFGDVRSQLRPGMQVAACGDFINAFAPTGRYPASPVGAILHWIHKKMRGSHPNGFMMIDGQLYGQEDAPPRGRFFGESFVGDLMGIFFPEACVGNYCN